MSDKKQTAADDGADDNVGAGDQQAGDTTPEILEATVIEETPEPVSDGGRGDAPRPRGQIKKPGISLAARAGWSVAALLAAFAGGVYLAPQFAPGLASLGLRAAPQNPAAGAAVDIQPLTSELEALRTAFNRQQEILAQHEAALTASGTARTKLADDLALLASRNLPSGEAATTPETVRALQSDIDRLSNDIARLSTLSGEGDPRVSQLTGALALARAEVTQLKSRLSSVEEAMQAVQAGALEASPRGRIVLALGRLRDRALTGQPFGADLSAIRPDFAALPAIDQQMIGADLTYLEERGMGIVAFEALVADYDAVAATAVKAQDMAEGGFLTNLFSTRRTDAGATGVDAVLLKAERALLARDVTGAVSALETLEGPALEATASWRAAAESHAGVLKAFDRLTARVANSQLPAPRAPLGEGTGQ